MSQKSFEKEKRFFRKTINSLRNKIYKQSQKIVIYLLSCMSIYIVIDLLLMLLLYLLTSSLILIETSLRIRLSTPLKNPLKNPLVPAHLSQPNLSFQRSNFNPSSHKTDLGFLWQFSYSSTSRNYSKPKTHS